MKLALTETGRWHAAPRGVPLCQRYTALHVRDGSESDIECRRCKDLIAGARADLRNAIAAAEWTGLLNKDEAATMMLITTREPIG